MKEFLAAVDVRSVEIMVDFNVVEWVILRKIVTPTLSLIEGLY